VHGTLFNNSINAAFEGALRLVVLTNQQFAN